MAESYTGEAPFVRLELLWGKAAVEKLAASRVLLVGVGGVGSWCGEMLVRSAIGSLTMLDPDTVHASNLNRQLCALQSTLGKLKVEVLESRFKDINPQAKIQGIPEKLTPENVGFWLEKEPWNCVVDAIDDRFAKIELLRQCVERRIPVVSSMGAAEKSLLGEVREDDISQSHHDRLARIVRKQLHKQGVFQGIRVIYSPEERGEDSPQMEGMPEGEKRPLGTIGYMPAEFGLRCAEAVLTILRDTMGSNNG